MKRLEMIKVENYFETFFILFLFALAFYIFKGFILPLLLAVSLVFLTYGFHLKLVSKIKNETLSALLVLLGVMFIILFPVFWIVNQLIKEITKMVLGGMDFATNIDLSFCSLEFCRQVENQVNFLDLSFSEIITTFSSYIYSSISSVFSSVTDFVLGFFIFAFAFFFLLKDGKKFVRYIKRIFPMQSDYKNALFLRFRDVTQAVFLNTILVSFLQGSLVGLMLWILGFNSPIFWTLLASLAAMLPLFGASLIWVPITIYLALTGHFISAVVLGVYGLLLVSVADNIARPFFLHKKINVHEFLIFLSILGGIQAFGFILGIFLGPIVISLLISVLQLYNLDFK